jgi:hypothetical protein
MGGEGRRRVNLTSADQATPCHVAHPSPTAGCANGPSGSTALRVRSVRACTDRLLPDGPGPFCLPPRLDALVSLMVGFHRRQDPKTT